MKQRDIWHADLSPATGSEQKGIRPIVVISGNAMNEHLGLAIICPLTTRIENYAGCLVIAADEKNGLESDSEIITFQVRVISRERLITRLGEISRQQLDSIRQGLADILTY